MGLVQVILLQSTEAEPPSAAAIALGIIGSLAFVGIGLIGQRKFRDGSAYVKVGRTNPRYADVAVRIGFTILPGIWTSGSAALFFALIELFIITDANFVGVLALAPALAMAGSFVWLLKEYFSPSERRRPDWWDQYKAD